MDFRWAVVYFPYAEYSICEDASALNIIVQRSGNVNVSSYVTISAIEQTAKESLDYVSRRVSKLQFDPGTVEVTWKIVIVKDDLEEAPIEQMQVILTDSENCIIINHNRTVVSIYDLNRGACTQVPVRRLEDNIKNNQNKNSIDTDESEENNDKENIGYSHFLMQCNQYIYGLLRYESSLQGLFQCDGEKWVRWYPNTSNVAPADPLQDYEMRKTEFSDLIITETPSSEPDDSTLPTTNAESCLKGWQEYSGKCYKWFRPQATWDNALNVCKSYPYGNLAIVESNDHNNWLLQLARNKSFWIGLHSFEESNDWHYVEDDEVVYFNWKKGFPRSQTSSGDSKHRCVLVRGSGLWINKNCDLHEHSYACFIPLL